MYGMQYVFSKQEYNHSEALGALANAAVVKSLIKCPVASVAFFGAILEVEVALAGGTAGGASLVEIVESPATLTVDGTARTPANKNRLDTPKTTTIGVFLNTDTTAGTALKSGIAALSQNFCSGPLILKPATNYVVRVTNQSGNNLIGGVINLTLRQIENFDQMYKKMY